MERTHCSQPWTPAQKVGKQGLPQPPGTHCSAWLLHHCSLILASTHFLSLGVWTCCHIRYKNFSLIFRTCLSPRAVMGEKIMSHFFSVLCGLGSVLTGQGRWCRIFKSCCLWGKRQQAAERAKYMFTTADSDMYLYRRWSGNLYFRINYIMKLL